MVMTSKQYTSQEIASIISSQFENQVALFNLKDKNAFFFISPEEARIAMDYIKQWRIDGFKQIAREKQLDEYVNNFKNNYNVETLDTTVIKDKFKKKDYFSIDFLNYSYALIECENRNVDAIIINNTTFAEIRNWGRTVFDEATKQEALGRGVYGRIFTADIYLLNSVEDYSLILVSMPTNIHKYFLVKKTVYIEKNYLINCLKQRCDDRKNVEEEYIMTKKNKKQIESLTTNEIGNCLINISKSKYGLCIEFIHPTQCSFSVTVDINDPKKSEIIALAKSIELMANNY